MFWGSGLTHSNWREVYHIPLSTIFIYYVTILVFKNKIFKTCLCGEDVYREKCVRIHSTDLWETWSDPSYWQTAAKLSTLCEVLVTQTKKERKQTKPCPYTVYLLIWMCVCVGGHFYI